MRERGKWRERERKERGRRGRGKQAARERKSRKLARPLGTPFPRPLSQTPFDPKESAAASLFRQDGAFWRWHSCAPLYSLCARAERHQMDGGSKDSKTRASLSASLCAAPARHAAAAANCEAVAPADRCARAVPAVTTRERDTERGGRSGVVVLAVAAAAAAPLRSLCPSLSIRRLAPRCVLTPAPHRVAPLHPPDASILLFTTHRTSPPSSPSS